MNPRTALPAVLLVGVVVSLGTECGGGKPVSPAGEKAAAKPTTETEAPLPPALLDTQLTEAARESLFQPFTGDLDGMVKRRLVRIGVTFNRSFYFVDKGVQRGIAYDYGRLIDDHLRKMARSR